MTDHATTRRVHTENQGLSGSQLTRPSCLPLNPGESEKLYSPRGWLAIGLVRRRSPPWPYPFQDRAGPLHPKQQEGVERQVVSRGVPLPW